MGRFKAKGITIRETNGLEIVFWDERTIYVRKSGERRYTVFHRWFAERGSYTNGWQDFRKNLWRSNRLSIIYCYELAAQFDVVSFCTDRELDFSQKTVFYRN